MSVIADLPRSAREIAEIIGRDRTLALIGALPKTTDPEHGERPMLYVPKKLSRKHPLVSYLCIGGPMDEDAAFAAAQKLVVAFGGEVLYPANCKRALSKCRDQHIAEAAARGMQPAAIAGKTTLTARQVRNIVHAQFKALYGAEKAPEE